MSEDDWVRLVRGVAGGDQAALHALYERAHRVVYTLALRITADRETAEEVTVDVFHDVWRRAASYDPQAGTVLGWIANQARSRALDRLRYQQRRKRVDPFRAEEGDEPFQTADAAESKQQNDLLRQAVGNLSPGERQAIASAYFADRTHAEVAAQLDQPLGTVKTRIRSALQKLRRAMGAEGSR